MLMAAVTCADSGRATRGAGGLLPRHSLASRGKAGGVRQAAWSGPRMAVSRAAAAIAGQDRVNDTWAQVNIATHDSRVADSRWSPRHDKAGTTRSAGREAGGQAGTERGQGPGSRGHNGARLRTSRRASKAAGSRPQEETQALRADGRALGRTGTRTHPGLAQHLGAAGRLRCGRGFPAQRLRSYREERKEGRGECGACGARHHGRAPGRKALPLPRLGARTAEQRRHVTSAHPGPGLGQADRCCRRQGHL